MFGSGFRARLRLHTQLLGRVVVRRCAERAQQSGAVFVQRDGERAGCVIHFQRPVRLPIGFERGRVGINVGWEAAKSTTFRVEEPRAVSRLNPFHEVGEPTGSNRDRQGHRSVVDELDGHIGPKAPRLDRDPLTAERVHNPVDQGFCQFRRSRGTFAARGAPGSDDRIQPGEVRDPTAERTAAGTGVDDDRGAGAEFVFVSG